MSYGIIRIQKFGASAVKGIEIHDQRKKDVSHTNQDIDREKTADNYALYESESFSVDVKTRINELNLKKTPRKDAIVMCQALITSDKEFFARIDKFHQEYFFKSALAFIQREYGPENIISATVHLDEKTPHMHVNFVPVTPDGRLSAKSLLTRESLRSLQTNFYRQVGQEYGLERGESREERRKHLDTEEFKQETRKARIIEIGASIIERERELKNREKAVNTGLREITNLPQVNVKYIEAADLEPVILKKKLFSTDIESKGMIAKRLNAHYVEPLAQIAKKTHGVAWEAEQNEKRFFRAAEVAEKYRKLTLNLKPEQVEELEKQANQFRQENKQEVEREREQRLTKSRDKGMSR